MNSLEDLFLAGLSDMYDAEHRLIKALPKVAKAATHEKLGKALEAHLAETEGHVEKLNGVFQAFDRQAKRKTCQAIVGLLKEGDEIAAENKGTPAINAALISAAQKVEHYEIASYGCLRTWAELLGNTEAAELLDEVLAEEKRADDKLTDIAVKICNPAADTLVNGHGTKGGKLARASKGSR